MNEQRRQVILIAVMLGMMLLLAGWSTASMLGHRNDARYAAQDLRRCQQLADQIKQHQSQDAVASTGDDAAMQEQKLAQRISEAAKQANLTGPWQQGIEHRREIRIEDSPYMRKPAVLITRGLTLHQLSLLLHHLTADSPYTAEQLQLRTPPGEETGNRWDADVTLTYLIYSPQPSGRDQR